MTRTSSLVLAIVSILGCGRDDRPPSTGSGSGSGIEPIAVHEDMVAIPGGRFRALGPRCDGRPDFAAASQDYRRTDHEGVTFTIDRHAVTCDEYAICAREHKCPEADESCSAGIAWPSLDSAKQFCAWRGATLPSFLQWQRAILGVEGQPFDGSSRPCDPTDRSTHARGIERCRFISEAGVEFGVHNVAAEWTRSSDCYVVGSELYVEPVAIDLRDDMIQRDLKRGGTSPFATVGEFRCVRDAESTGR